MSSVSSINPFGLVGSLGLGMSDCQRIMASVGTVVPDGTATTALVVVPSGLTTQTFRARVDMARRFGQASLSQFSDVRQDSTSVPQSFLPGSRLVQVGAAALLGFGWGKELLLDEITREHYVQDLQMSKRCKPYPALKQALAQAGFTDEQKTQVLNLMYRQCANNPEKLKDVMKLITRVIKALDGSDRLGLTAEHKSALISMICEKLCRHPSLPDNMNHIPDLIRTTSRFVLQPEHRMRFLEFVVSQYLNDTLSSHYCLSRTMRLVQSFKDVSDEKKICFLMQIKDSSWARNLASQSALETAILSMRRFHFPSQDMITLLSQLSHLAQHETPRCFRQLSTVLSLDFVPDLPPKEIQAMLSAYTALVAYAPHSDAHWRILLAIEQEAGDQICATYEALASAATSIKDFPFQHLGLLETFLQIAVRRKAGAANAYAELPQRIRTLRTNHRRSSESEILEKLINDENPGV